jgi:hypothetical protein
MKDAAPLREGVVGKQPRGVTLGSCDCVVAQDAFFDTLGGVVAFGILHVRGTSAE